jgi:hypothetical protein
VGPECALSLITSPAVTDEVAKWGTTASEKWSSTVASQRQEVDLLEQAMAGSYAEVSM